MSGRYAVEMMLILWTGLGLRVAHVLQVGGPEIAITFRKVSEIRSHIFTFNEEIGVLVSSQSIPID